MKNYLTRLRSTLGRIRRAVRTRLDSTLHPSRRNHALRCLRDVRAEGDVLFLCLGNVCRSPYAEARFRSILGKEVSQSAGFIGPGRQPPEKALDTASVRGLDLSAHRSRIVTREQVRASRLVVVMEAKQLRAVYRTVPGPIPPVVVLGDLDPLDVKSRTITDPWGKGEEVFQAVFERIDRCLEALAREIGPTVAR